MNRPTVGDTIGSWEVLGVLGAGGMGVVYDVKHRVTGKSGALKVVRFSGPHASIMEAKLLEEARLLAQIHHEHLVDVYDAGAGEVQGYPWMVMEKLRGCPLADIIRQGPLSLQRALGFTEDVASAVSCVHAAGVVHRDLKPDNIYVTEREIVKVLDFGASRFRKGGTAGGAIGTDRYMSPEQLSAPASIDGRSDVWALGLILHQMLTGKHVYQAEDGQWLVQGRVYLLTLSREPVSTFEDVDARVRPILLKATAKDREQRYASMDDFAAAIQQLRQLVQGPIYAPTARLSSAEISAAISNTKTAPPAAQTAPMSSTAKALIASASVPPSQQPSVPGWAVTTIALLAVLVGVVVILLVLSGQRNGDAAATTTTTSTTPPLVSAIATSIHRPPQPKVTASGVPSPRAQASAVDSVSTSSQALAPKRPLVVSTPAVGAAPHAPSAVRHVPTTPSTSPKWKDLGL